MGSEEEFITIRVKKNSPAHKRIIGEQQTLSSHPVFDITTDVEELKVKLLQLETNVTDMHSDIHEYNCELHENNYRLEQRIYNLEQILETAKHDFNAVYSTVYSQHIINNEDAIKDNREAILRILQKTIYNLNTRITYKPMPKKGHMVNI